MPTIGEQLRTARETRGITIAEIATATRINAVYLERIERDLPLDLPPTYARAFVKSFASAVGLDPEPLFAAQAPPPPDPPRDEGIEERPVQAARPVVLRAGAIRQEPVPIKQHQTRSLVIFSVVVLLGLAASLFFISRHRDESPVREVSFADVAKERDTAQQPATRDTGTARSVAPLHEAIDSLSLEAVSVETVWVRVVVDSLLTREYTLAPQHRLTWKAARSFRVSVGNAAGIYFSLNGKHLGALGAGRTPVKAILLTRATLTQGDASTAEQHDGNSKNR